MIHIQDGGVLGSGWLDDDAIEEIDNNKVVKRLIIPLDQNYEQHHFDLTETMTVRMMLIFIAMVIRQWPNAMFWN